MGLQHPRPVRHRGEPAQRAVFAREMNGSWFPWGTSHATPAQFVAAWRHVVSIFRRQGADNATWMWTLHSSGVSAAAIKAHWPGSNYVNWVGLDGYYAVPQTTFQQVFGLTIAKIRAITSKPILISESAVGPGTRHQPYDIKNLIRGVSRDHLLGLVWFDVAQHDPPYHQDWRLEGNPAALAAFRNAIARYF